MNKPLLMNNNEEAWLNENEEPWLNENEEKKPTNDQGKKLFQTFIDPMKSNSRFINTTTI